MISEQSDAVLAGIGVSREAVVSWQVSAASSQVVAVEKHVDEDGGTAHVICSCNLFNVVTLMRSTCYPSTPLPSSWWLPARGWRGATTQRVTGKLWWC